MKLRPVNKRELFTVMTLTLQWVVSTEVVINLNVCSVFGNDFVRVACLIFLRLPSCINLFHKVDTCIVHSIVLWNIHVHLIVFWNSFNREWLINRLHYWVQPNVVIAWEMSDNSVMISTGCSMLT